MENKDSSNAIVENVPVENPDVLFVEVPVGTTGEIVVVDSPSWQQMLTPYSVLSDHQLEVSGVIYRESKTLNRVVSQVLL